MTISRPLTFEPQAIQPPGAFMRRIAPLLIVLSLPGCTGFGAFIDHTVSLPGRNPNIPMADSENVRRAVGRPAPVTPIKPEPGNVWPGPQPAEPTLSNIEQQQGNQTFSPESTSGNTPAQPDHRQPRRRGSSTPPGNTLLSPYQPPNLTPAPPPLSRIPGPSPQGQIVQTPEGPGVDAGGTNTYRQLTTPRGPGAIIVPNGNGTSTIINPDGSVQTIPTPRR